MNERGFVMTDQVWQRLAPHLLGKTSAQKPQRAVPDPRWAHLNTKAERTDCQNTKISMACKITTAPFCGEGRAPPGLRPRESCALLRSLGKASDAGATAKDHRLFLEAVFWRGSDRRTTARLTACFRQLEQPVSAVSTMGHGGLIRGGGMNVL